MTSLHAVNQYIGKQATLNCDGIVFNVKIIDAKTSYGITRVQIEPVSGLGNKWVNLPSIKIKEAKP